MSTELIIGFIILSVFVCLTFALRLAHQFLFREREFTLSSNENTSAGIETAGYYFGIIIILGAALSSVSVQEKAITTLINNGTITYLSFAATTALFGVVGLSLHVFFGRLATSTLLNIAIRPAIESNTLSIGLVSAASYVSSAFVITGSISGFYQVESLLPTLIFLCIGIATLWILTYLFRFMTRYNDSVEICNGNTAAALSYSGIMIAISIIIRHAIEGEFVDYTTSLILYAKSLGIILFVYPIRQLIVQVILLRTPFYFYGGVLDEEIEQNQNISAGIIEASTYIASALLALSIGY